MLGHSLNAQVEVDSAFENTVLEIWTPEHAQFVVIGI